MEHVFTGIWVVLGLIMLKFYGKRKAVVSSAFLGMMSGGLSLTAAHYIAGHMGYTVPVNLFSTVVSLVLGLPGTMLTVCVNFVL